MAKSEFIIKSALVQKREHEKKPGYKVEIGGLDANFDDDMLADQNLKKVLLKIGTKLCKQLKCDAVIFNGLSFQRWWKIEDKN